MQFDAPINATDTSFDRILAQASVPVVAAFWSAQETSREKLDAALESSAQAYADEVLFLRLDIRDAPQAAEQYGVRTGPQFLFFREGKLVARARGVPTSETLRPWIEYVLERGPEPTTHHREPEKDRTSEGRPVAVTDATFDQVVLQAETPVLVDFWAAWCGPCHTLAPVIEELAKHYAKRAVVAKLDVDANPATARRYRVMSIPTLIVFHQGREVDRITGVQPRRVIENRLESVL